MSERALVSVVARTLRAVFKRAGVEGAHAHRFRHTLATEILARGGAEQDAEEPSQDDRPRRGDQRQRGSEALRQVESGPPAADHQLVPGHLSGHNLCTRRKNAASGGIKIAIIN